MVYFAWAYDTFLSDFKRLIWNRKSYRKKIERDLEHARMNFMNFHQREPDNENQELPQRQFTVNVQFDPVRWNWVLLAPITRSELTVVLMVSWLLFLYHWILNADWMLMWNFFRAIYFFDWYWLFCIRAHRLLYVHCFSCCALNMSIWYLVTRLYHVGSIRLHFITSCTRMIFSLSIPSHVLIIIVNNSTMIIINDAHQINTATLAILLSKKLRAAF